LDWPEEIMSRIGKLPVEVPSGVTANLDGQNLSVKGPKGELNMVFMDDVIAKLEDGSLTVKPRSNSKRSRQAWGMQRTLANNLVQGVTQGFKVELEINGVGYRAAVQGNNLQLALGFSHDVLYPIPDGIKITCERPTAITVEGIDRRQVGQVAAEIRSYRPPEPYKGKGVKYATETIQRKEGKKK
jgi:large subunit ribosomal protein L6